MNDKIHWTAPILVLPLCLWAALYSQAWAQSVSFQMRPGDSLWNIARQHLDLPSRWQDILDANAISDPQLLRPGEVVRIKEDWFLTSPMAVNITASEGASTIEHASQKRVLAEGVIEQPANSTIETSATGRTTLTFENGCTITLSPDSKLKIDRVRYLGIGLIPDIGITLLTGNASVTYPDQGFNRGRLDIRTRSATTSVRGTNFRMAFDAETGQARGETLKGLIDFRTLSASVQLPTETGSLAERDRPPLQPITLLPPPELSNLPAQTADMPFEIEFDAIEGAKAYRLSIHPADTPLQIRGERVSGLTRAEFNRLDDGDYVITARSIDENGLEGRDAEKSITVDARPRRPGLRRPIQDGRIIVPRPEFAWAVDEAPLTFRFELARDRAFTEIVSSQAGLSSARYALNQDLLPGRYFWRVASTDSSGDEGLTAEPESFRFLPPLPAVAPAVSLNSDGRLEAAWNALALAERYRVEFSSDNGFENAKRTRETSDLSVDLGRPLAGDNWVRIVAIDADGVEGQASTPVLFTQKPPPWWQALGLPGLGALALVLLL